MRTLHLSSLGLALIGLVACIPTLVSEPPVQAHSVQNITSNPETPRQDILINSDWSYLEYSADYEGVRGYDESAWEGIALPHTWNALDATDNDPGYRRSASWYRKHLFIPAGDARWKLYFEGVNISSRIYVNGKAAGGHVGGYIGFDVDISPYVHRNAVNEILVWVDNSVNPNIIPSQKSDFFIFGGITRDVWLQERPLLELEAIRVTPTEVSSSSAQTTMETEILNASSSAVSAVLNYRLLDRNSKQVLKGEQSIELDKGPNQVSIELPLLDNPELWSPADPALYTLEATLTAGEISDQASQRFGYRWFEFKDHGPFYLNGERLLLRGTHRHEEWAGMGNAMPNELHRKDMEMIKEMGANFVRLAHYPQDPEIYRACDELGLLVWDELPWCRGGMGGDEWKSNTERLFREQINQNYNHPSIILWSVGNELYWQPDFEGGGEIEALKDYVSHLNDIAHEMDKTRLTTMRKFYDGAEITDVFSPSIWAGWYSGVYKTFEKAISNANKKYKHFFHMEYGGSSHVGRHTENPITGEGYVKEDEWDEKPNMINVKRVSESGDWSESYIVDLFDWHLMVSESSPWLTGNAQWAFKDFGTPLRPENAIPYINQKGLVDREGNPKDAYYVFKSYWSDDPFCYIESHTWTERFGKSGELKEINVFSNCDEVELLLNGTALGRKTKALKDFPANGLRWEVSFREGENNLEAIGYIDGVERSRDSMRLQYIADQPGKPERISLKESRLADGRILIHAMVVDKDGKPCPQYNKRVYFAIDGPGDLLRHQGTPTGSDVIEFASGRAAIQFIPGGAGTSTIEARTQDFKGDYLKVVTP